LLSILSGTPIHTQVNQQSIYRITINNEIINVSYIQLSTILILPISKEGIINSLNFCISSFFIFLLSLLGSIFTTLHTIKVWVYCFNYLLSTYSSSQSTSFVILILNSLLIDESLEYCFALSAFTLFYISDYESIFTYSISNSYFSIIIWIAYLFIYCYFSVYILKDSFSSFQTFYIPFFQDTFLLFSSFFFKGPIYWIEALISNNNINWYYCHYFSNIQFITFMLLLFLVPLIPLFNSLFLVCFSFAGSFSLFRSRFSELGSIKEQLLLNYPK